MDADLVEHPFSGMTYKTNKLGGFRDESTGRAGKSGENEFHF